MKLIPLVLASSVLMASAAFAVTHAVTEKSHAGESIKFVMNSSVPNASLTGYSYSVFLYNDLNNAFSSNNSANTNNIDTFSPNEHGPYPGQVMTRGKLGVFAGVPSGDGDGSYDDVCHISLKAILVSDPTKGPLNFTSEGETPTVKSESTKYACLAYLDGPQTVLIDVIPNS